MATAATRKYPLVIVYRFVSQISPHGTKMATCIFLNLCIELRTV